MVHESVRSHPRWCTTVSTGSRTGTEPSPTSPTENSSLAAPSNCGGDRSLAPRRQEQNHHPAGEGHHPLPASRRAEPVTSRDAITSSQPPLRGNRAGAGYPAGSYFINCQIASASSAAWQARDHSGPPAQDRQHRNSYATPRAGSARSCLPPLSGPQRVRRVVCAFAERGVGVHCVLLGAPWRNSVCARRNSARPCRISDVV